MFKNIITTCIILLFILSISPCESETEKLNNGIDAKILSLIYDKYDKSKRDWRYVYSMASINMMIWTKGDKSVADRISTRYANIITKMCNKYNIDVRLFARLVLKESGYKWYAYSKKNGIPFAFGPTQVTMDWQHVLYVVDDGKLGKKLKEMEKRGIKIDHSKYLKRIGYGIEAGCIVLKYYLKKYNNDYKLALLAYWSGPRSKDFKYWSQIKNRNNNEYIKKIYFDDWKEELIVLGFDPKSIESTTASKNSIL